MELDASVVWDFAGELVGTLTQRNGRTLATVTRIDPDGTTWVTTDGDGEAPAVGVAAGVAVGDTVALEWDGSTMGIRANVSDPAPTGAVVRHAQRVASAAQKVAEAVNQHFFTDTHGIHVTEATQEDWEQSHSGPNVLINSLGQLFRDGLNNLLTLTTENGARALTIWDGLGNNAANVLAVFGEIVRIGRAGCANVTIGSDSIDLNISNIVAGALQLISEASRVGAQLLFYDGAARVSGCVTRGGIVEVSIGAQGTSVTIDSAGNLAMTDGTTSGSVPIEDALKAIAAQCGSVGQTTSVPAGGYADVPVTFARAYDSTPTVVVGMLSTSTSSEIGLCSVALESASATGFTARLFNAGASARRPSFCWIAIG